MLTLVFVFMLFNLTSIWNLPTISTAVHGHDGVPSLVGFFVHGRVRKAAPQGIPRWRQLLIFLNDYWRILQAHRTIA